MTTKKMLRAAIALTLIIGSAPASKVFSNDSSKWKTSAEFLLLSPGIGDTGFVISAPAGDPVGEAVSNEIGFKGAYRVGFGYHPSANRQYHMNFTQLSGKERKTVAGESLFSTKGTGDTGFESYQGTASSENEVSFSRVELSVSEPLNDSASGVSLLYGLEYARFGLNENSSYVEGANELHVSQASTMSGFGPSLGLKLKRDLGPLSFAFLASTSLLRANTSASNMDSDENGGQEMNVQGENASALIPALRARLSLSYGMDIGNSQAVLVLGYEHQSYVNAVTRVANHDDVSDGLLVATQNNFDLSGPSLALGLKF